MARSIIATLAPLIAMAVAGCTPTAGAGPVRAGTAETAGPALALDFGGLRVVEQSGRTSPIPFGEPSGEASARVAIVLNQEGVEERTIVCDGRILHQGIWPVGLVMNVSADRKFAGWEVRRPGLTTMNGLGVGTTLAELRELFDVTVEETRFGAEFRIGDAEDGSIGGMLQSHAPAARVTRLWSGASCPHG